MNMQELVETTLRSEFVALSHGTEAQLDSALIEILAEINKIKVDSTYLKLLIVTNNRYAFHNSLSCPTAVKFCSPDTLVEQEAADVTFIDNDAATTLLRAFDAKKLREMLPTGTVIAGAKGALPIAGVYDSIKYSCIFRIAPTGLRMLDILNKIDKEDVPDVALYEKGGYFHTPRTFIKNNQLDSDTSVEYLLNNDRLWVTAEEARALLTVEKMDKYLEEYKAKQYILIKTPKDFRIVGLGGNDFILVLVRCERLEFTSFWLDDKEVELVESLGIHTHNGFVSYEEAERVVRLN